MSKKDKILIALGLLFVVFLIFYLALKLGSSGSSQDQVCFKNICFQVELARTDQERARGLMNQTKLGANQGMLFVFEKEGIYPFWMKKTLLPLDIIWISANKEVVFINKNSQPCKQEICPTISPTKNAKYVLEINGGLTEQIGLKEGDVFNFNIKE